MGVESTMVSLPDLGFISDSLSSWLLALLALIARSCFPYWPCSQSPKSPCPKLSQLPEDIPQPTICWGRETKAQLNLGHPERYLSSKTQLNQLLLPPDSSFLSSLKLFFLKGLPHATPLSQYLNFCCQITQLSIRSGSKKQTMNVILEIDHWLDGWQWGPHHEWLVENKQPWSRAVIKAITGGDVG